jgi:replication factor A1
LSEIRKIADLKEGLEDLNLKVRVVEARKPKIIQTKRGSRVISEAIVGDETGRVKLTLWGKQAGTLKEGEAIEIKGAWTTSYRGEVQLNIGSRGEITRIDENEVPPPEDIPKKTPKAESRTQYSRGRQGFSRQGGFRKRRA